MPQLILIVENHRAPAVDEDAVVNVGADAAGKREPFTIAAEAEEIFRLVKVFHADDFLVDDRPGVEVAGDVMAGGTDEFNPAFVGFFVRIRADERRQKRVVDVDDSARIFPAKLRRQNLHVAGKNDEINPCLLYTSDAADE